MLNLTPNARRVHHHLLTRGYRVTVRNDGYHLTVTAECPILGACRQRSGPFRDHSATFRDLLRDLEGPAGVERVFPQRQRARLLTTYSG